MDFETGSVEAFLDLGCGDDTPLGSPSCRAGYRLIESGEVICTVKLPISIAEAAILRRSEISIILTPDGRVEVSSCGSAANEQIDELVARAVTQANLRMEEATASDLESLLHRLERSIGLVKEAIARAPAAP
ncbi:hypothetical protein CI1B_76290 [Bradyrhizobium ivorense]|uniref:Uncharacterized protein n=1 Tax=Bradyrhizobium ivorense TaxID=2511166 RepID=A0A508TX95_9BRAD|nr:hypothetical protein [Bradyrhizobium ivorense]VIO78999.1 hypothetical protein CI1B_76290 [Bradyrhizobium ivorense]